MADKSTDSDKAKTSGTAETLARGPPDLNAPYSLTPAPSSEIKTKIKLSAQMPIVAIGASAGGLEAASALLDALPANSGMTFILIQHLDPAHPSLMAGLLATHTAMNVVEATDGAQLVANQVQVIPPGRYLSIRAGTIHLTPPQSQHGARLPFDTLLSSLAIGPHAAHTIAVVLSGTGADGSAALTDLKTAGGHAIAQDPAEADYGGMPQSAIATGQIDQTLPLKAIPQALAAIASKFEAHGSKPEQGPGDTTESPAPNGGIDEIIALINDKTSHDFRQYKPGTLQRRIDRRIGLLSMPRGDFSAYLARLQKDAAERDLLARDLLINVTSFFRDPDVFDLLAADILPDMVRNLPDQQPLRVWVAGCSTGEEAYSLAILCNEAIAVSGRKIKLQVFASDVDAEAIATAREGFFPLDCVGAISKKRLAQHFIRDEAGLRVTADLRADVVFTVQDVLSDPPFSRIDLVSCRNLLIYLNVEAQARVVSLFHFALREGGVLVLGSSETVGATDDRFKVIAKTERVYRHVARSRVTDPGFPLSFGDTLPRLGDSKVTTANPARQATLAEICRRAVLATHAPAAVLINAKRQCLYAMGPIERFLRMAPGYASLDVLAMATPALRTRLRLAIDKIGKATPRVDGGRTRLTHNSQTIRFSIDIQALAGDHEDLILICFVEEPETSGAQVNPSGRNDAARVSELEGELEATHAELQTAIENLETSTQEQKAINDEALSVNEEFQSTNEELLTSKEELQSLNEELTALNSQLQETLERQRLTSDDLQNVLYSTNVGTLFLDKDLKIRFYTPAIKALFSVIAADIGRPLGDLRPIATDANLLDDARRVLADETAIEREVSTPNDAWFLRRIFPYRAHDNRIEGVVITFADVTERNTAAKALEAAKLEAERANLAKSRFLAAASHDLRQPLQSLTLLQELLNQSVEGERPRKLLGRFEQTLGAMSGMLNALLDINQIEAGVVEAHPANFAISDVFDRLRDEFTYLAQTRNLSLHILHSTAMVRSDPHLLEQMIRNLLGNAVKYTRRGKILLGCRHRNGTVRIEVWDTGIGIAEAEQHAIFEEFHQIDNGARDRRRGLGLGLSIVQRLGRLLGHDVDVWSVPGKGSTFSVTVADAAPDATTFGPHAIVAAAIEKDNVGQDIIAPTSEEAPHRCKVVIVEDDADVLELLEQLIKGDGRITRTAPDAAAALKLIADGAIQPDVLLTDYNLPGGQTGLDLISSLRAILPRPLPAIILTGDISTATLATIAAHDCIQLSKPVKPRELCAAISRLCPPTAAESHPLREVSTGASQRTPSVYVVDDDPEIRLSLREVLEHAGRTVSDFASAEDFLKAYRPGEEGCLLVDAYLPGMSGINLLDTLRARGDNLPVILITGSGDVGLAVTAMRNGACDFIEKPVGRVELLASITRAIDQSRGIRLSDAAHEQAVAHVAALTTRQREVMDLVLAGHPSKNIAVDLGISQRTVENHRAAIMVRMGAKSLPELARIAQAAATREKTT